MPDKMVSFRWCYHCQRSGAIGLPDGERVDGPVEGLRADQVSEQRGGGPGQAAARQQGPRRLLPPGEKKRQLVAQPAFDSPHNVDNDD